MCSKKVVTRRNYKKHTDNVKQICKELFFKNVSSTEIADSVNVPRSTIEGWIEKENWHNEYQSMVKAGEMYFRIKKGDAIGYGGDYKCPQDMSVGVVACGYGDGYPRGVSQDAELWLADRRVKLVGRVSMDLISIDLRDLPQAKVGDEVELWGENVLATEVASAANTISYEILSRVAPRVPRVLDGVVG